MKLIYLKSANVSFSIEIPVFRVSFTIEPGHSLLQFVTTNCLMFKASGYDTGKIILNVTLCPKRGI